ncbi:MAG: bifunctional diguanylate cyclase/phosphodiesterase [Colwellia sp.]
MDMLLNHVLNAMDQVVFEIIDMDKNTVKLVEGNSEWVSELFPLSDNHHTFNIDDETPFLFDFFFDARLIWHDKTNGKVRSGFWTEVTKNKTELHLEAIAIRHENYNLLVITNQSEEFIFRQNTMQSARELLLHNDNLLEQNEHLHARLQDILKKPSGNNNILVKTIENAEFSVVITDENFTMLIENSAALNIFQCGKLSDNQTISPINIITSLLKNQVPEYDRIQSTKSSWAGELCWMSPPATLKWLKIALYPVLNELNEVRNWIVFVNDISNIKYLVQRNEQLALHDMLTDLPNRLSFWQTLEKQMISKIPFYLLYVDINDFRRHNEFYGHGEGDKLLKEFGERIKNTIKKSDYIARVGGDEFAIILANIDSQAACKKIVQRIISGIKRPFYSNRSDHFNVSVSIGAANFPHDAQSVEELMKFVDLSAYNGKQGKQGKQGKNNSLQFYSESLKDASFQLLEMEHELKNAVKNNEFELFLQPIIDLEQNKIVKAEALIRWNHPNKGLISPEQFIPLAEKSELIITIGKWVLNTACKIAKIMYDNGYKIKVSFNLSPSQVLDENLFPYLYSCVKNHKIDPSFLELEVTEGVLVDDYAVTDLLLSKVRAIGMTVSVDDFGTGYSSLAYLKKLPLDFLKIDRSFIKDIVKDDNDKAIVRAVIAMAHNLNLGVIAEGVETQEQLDFLAKNSCNYVQGYLFSRPVNFKSFVELFHQQKTLTNVE